MSNADIPLPSTAEWHAIYRELQGLEAGAFAERLNGLWLDLMHRTGDPAIAFHSGAASLPLETPLAGILLTSSNAWDALRRCFKGVREHNPPSYDRFLESGNEASVSLEYALPAEPLPYDAEFRLAMLQQIIRTLRGPGLCPVAVELRAATPPYAAEMDRYFGVPVRFGAPLNRIAWERPALERPFGMDANFYADLGHRIEQACAQQAERSEASLRVHGLVMQSLGQGYGGMKSLAPKLGLSSRTLQRRLQNEGTTYQELLDATRKRLCLSYLRAPTRSLEEIAGSLGYANMPNFHRAFKRWFGVPPAKFRRRLGLPAAPEAPRRARMRTVPHVAATAAEELQRPDRPPEGRHVV